MWGEGLKWVIISPITCVLKWHSQFKCKWVRERVMASSYGLWRTVKLVPRHHHVACQQITELDRAFMHGMGVGVKWRGNIGAQEMSWTTIRWIEWYGVVAKMTRRSTRMKCSEWLGSFYCLSDEMQSGCNGRYELYSSWSILSIWLSATIAVMSFIIGADQEEEDEWIVV